MIDLIFLIENRKINLLSCCYALAPSAAGGLAPAIALTDDALRHLSKMRSEKSEDLCLRIGVKQGGCSGMSYTMEFESRANARPDDSVMEYNGFVIGIITFLSTLIYWKPFFYDRVHSADVVLLSVVLQFVIRKASCFSTVCNWTTVMRSSGEVLTSRIRTRLRHVVVGNLLLQICEFVGRETIEYRTCILHHSMMETHIVV